MLGHFRKQIGFDDSFDVTKCFQQIKIPDLFHMCAEWNEQPSNLKTMSLCQHNSILIALFKIKHKNFCMSKKSCPYLYRNLQTKNGPDFLDMQYSIPSWMNGSSHSGRHQPHPESGLYMVRILDGNSEIGANEGAISVIWYV